MYIGLPLFVSAGVSVQGTNYYMRQMHCVNYPKHLEELYKETAYPLQSDTLLDTESALRCTGNQLNQSGQWSHLALERDDMWWTGPENLHSGRLGGSFLYPQQ